MDGILILGHGSMRKEANDILSRVADLMRIRLPGKKIQAAFMQFGSPDFFEGAKALIDAGVTRVIVHPYFLAPGDHVNKDIPGMIGRMETDHPAVRFVLTRPLQVHDALGEVVAERIAEAVSDDGRGQYVPEPASGKPEQIEAESFRIIESELGPTPHTPAERSVLVRVIHATGDFGFSDNLRFHPAAIEAGIEALRKGKKILTDVRMVEAGISEKRLAGWGGTVMCRISDPAAAERAAASGWTRSEAAMELAADEDVKEERKKIGIVAVGNAPTALFRVMELIDAGRLKPDLVVGVPVGFVRAAESKLSLSQKKYPFITCLGRKGGSPVAAAIVNALIRLAEKEA